MLQRLLFQSVDECILHHLHAPGRRHHPLALHDVSYHRCPGFLEIFLKLRSRQPRRPSPPSNSAPPGLAATLSPAALRQIIRPSCPPPCVACAPSPSLHSGGYRSTATLPAPYHNSLRGGILLPMLLAAYAPYAADAPAKCQIATFGAAFPNVFVSFISFLLAQFSSCKSWLYPPVKIPSTVCLRLCGHQIISAQYKSAPRRSSPPPSISSAPAARGLVGMTFANFVIAFTLAERSRSFSSCLSATRHIRRLSLSTVRNNS